MKVFISQPMRDKTDEQIKQERLNAIEDIKYRFKTDDVEIIDSFFEGAPYDAKPLWFLSKSLELLSIADVIYMCNGWREYRGCRIEYLCAAEYGIQIMEYGFGKMKVLDTKHNTNPLFMQNDLNIEYIDSIKVGVDNE